MAKTAPEPKANRTPHPNKNNPKKQTGRGLSDYEKARHKQIGENKPRLRDLTAAKCNMTRPHTPQKLVKDENSKPLPKQSHNNCGIHTVFRILTAHNTYLHEKFSTSVIEKNSTAIRAWLYSSLSMKIKGF